LGARNHDPLVPDSARSFLIDFATDSVAGQHGLYDALNVHLGGFSVRAIRYYDFYNNIVGTNAADVLEHPEK